jgi:hypothetical protein
MQISQLSFLQMNNVPYYTSVQADEHIKNEQSLTSVMGRASRLNQLLSAKCILK